ncbi:PAS domain-containing sensor histidine kinase [Clostridium felsineum]|uniref:PAS domain-containing sensor histidine kinase n=1 Tax=Clostridium felsineum TaxID=36839 RepID=UPI00098C44D0|nr:ATP-binding protein [Clostridium felsineum]URZ02372.1 Adaptive-response sensory-kinase SasA [Clostridium felsineum]
MDNKTITNCKLYNIIMQELDINIAIIIFDKSGKIIDFNKSTENMWKCSREDLINKNIGNLFEEDIMEHINADNISKEGNEISKVCTVDTDNGDNYLHVTFYNIKDNEGKSEIFIIACRDVTEKNNLVNKLAAKEKELQDTKAEFQKIKDNIMKIDKMVSVGELLAGIIHEINNPLGFIISNFQTLKKYIEKIKTVIDLYEKCVSNYPNNMDYFKDSLNTVIDLEKKYGLDFILNDMDELFKDTENGIERVRKIIGAVRSFSHVDLNEEFDFIDLNESIDNTLIIARNELKYDCNIEKNLQDIPKIQAKSSEINQALLNLIINASHAIKEKREKNNIKEMGTITIKTYNENEFVCCSIEDTGVGIPKENFEKIFKPLFTTKGVGKGTGLGLSITYEIIKNKHNGQIKVESDIGVGTTFTIKIPIHQDKRKESYE